jgi:hypothetical protein
VRTYVHGRLFGLHFVHCSWICLHHFMAFSVSGDMTFRPGPSVSLDVPGSAGTSAGVPVAGERAVDRVQVCGIRTLLPATVLVWLVRHGLSVSGRAAHVHASLSLLFNGP